MSRPHHVAIAACRASTTAPASELYPNPDWPLIRDAFHALGIAAVQVAWDDPAIEWSDFPIVVVRSTWDSVDRPQEFVAWARRVESVSRLVNPLAVISWNLDKRYLTELGELGVPVVATQWVEPGDAWEPPVEGDFVVKPSTSAGARETARYTSADETAARAHVARLQEAGRTVMVQAYMPSVEGEGECKLVFLGGTFSHAIAVEALLRPSAGVLDRPWEIDTSPRATPPAPEQLEVARAVVARIEARLGLRPAYARIDLVRDASRRPRVLEAELIDPLLFLPLAPPQAADRLARAALDATTPISRRTPVRRSPRR